VNFNTLISSGWFPQWGRPAWITNSFPVIRIILMILMLISALLLVVCILFQQTKSSGLGAISGGSTDTYYYKNKGKSLEGILKKATIILAICALAFTVLFLISVQIYSPNLDRPPAEAAESALGLLSGYFR